MKSKLLTIALIALAIVGLSKLKHYWDSRRDVITAPVLTEAENSKVIVDTSKREVRVVKRNGDDQVVETISGVRHIATVENKDGTVDYKIITKGFIFEPGICIGVDSSTALVGIDAQWFYWRKFGAVTGVTVPYDTIRFSKLRLHVGLSYDLTSFKLNNTSAYAGIDTAKRFVFGARIRF